MNLRPFVPLIVGAAIGVVGVAIWNATHPRQNAAESAALPPTVRPSPLHNQVPNLPRPEAIAIETPPPSTPSARPPAPQKEALADLDNVQSMLRDFRTRLGENPVGTNAEIMQSVMGGNVFQARLGPPEGQSLNDRGELVDRWGTAYFFHQLSSTETEIRSAGPDRQMWTADDVVMK